MKFDIFGKKQLEVVRRDGRWVAYYSNGNGLRRIADDIAIPAELASSELEEYIADIFHEWATSDNASVIRLIGATKS